MESIACAACNWRFYRLGEQETTDCPHCRSQNLSLLSDAKDYAPEQIVPFGISRQTFDQQIAQFAKGIPFCPKDLTAANLQQRMEEIFLPQYLFDADVEGVWQAEMGFDYEVVSHQEIYESSQWRTVERNEVRKNWSTRVGLIARHYDNVAAPALLDAGLLHREIGAYSFEKAEPVDGRQIAPWIRVPDRDIEDAWRDALSGFRERAGDECRAASGADHVEQFKWTPEFRNRHDTLMLLPVYASFYLDDDGEVCRVLMNGQSGKVGGARRASEKRAKIWAVNLLVTAVVLLAISFVLGLASVLFPPMGIIAVLLFAGCLAAGVGAALPVFIARQFNRKQAVSTRR